MVASNRKFDPKGEKAFGYLFFIVFLFLGFVFRDSSASVQIIFYSIAALCLLLAVFRPASLRLPLKFWMFFGLAVSKVTNPIIMGLMFYFILTPFSVVGFLLRRDELKLRKPLTNSFWEKPEQEFNEKIDFDKQF